MPTRVTGRARDLVILLDKLIYIFAKHWLFAVNWAAAIYVGLPILAPILMAKGHERLARLIYTAYAFACHQLPERAYFLYGPRHFYSLEELRFLVGPGVPPRYIGDPNIGYAVAFCQRDVAIYMTIPIAGIAFALVRRWLRPLTWKQLLLFSLPLIVDGSGQLLGIWESTWVSRTITGVLAAAGAVWFVYPYIEAGMEDVRRTIERQLHLSGEISGPPRDEYENHEAQGAQDH